MPPITGELTKYGLRDDLVLPFLLTWYGWLSREQGEVAKKRKLIFVKRQRSTGSSERLAQLTARGNRMIKRWTAADLGADAGFSYATYLKEYGLVSSDHHYVYPGRLLSTESDALDWQHRVEKFGSAFD